MKRFIFYMIVYLGFIGGMIILIWNKFDLSLSSYFTLIKSDLKTQIISGLFLYYVLALLVNIIIASISMSKQCAFSFYGRPIEFHGDTINTYDLGRITFRTKKGDLEAFQIYTTRLLELPTYQCMFNVGISKNGTVKTMYEVDNAKEKCSYEYVRYHNYISSILMLILISALPILGIIIVFLKTKEMR